MATNSNVNNCKTSCCVFNFYTQTVYNPNPPRLWSRFGSVCPCYPTNPCLQSLSSWNQSQSSNKTDSFICLSSGDDCTKAIAGGGLPPLVGIWYSTDGGINWSRSSGGSQVNVDLIFSLSSSSSGNIAIAGIGNSGLWYSTNSGQYWTQSNENSGTFSFISISGNGVNAVAGSKVGGKMLWYSTSSTSTICGAIWQQSASSSANYANYEFISVSINSNGANAVAVGKYLSETSLWYSINGGAHWKISLTVPHFSLNGSFKFVVISRDGTKAIAGGDAGTLSSIGLYYSINGGQNWLPSTLTPIIPSIIFNSASISTNGLKMVASSSNNGIWYSSDGGQTWSQGYVGTHVDSVVISGDGKNAVAGGSLGSFGLLYSIDSGKTWTQTSKTNNNFPSIVINNDGTRAIAANLGNLGNDDGIWYSECTEQIIPCSTDFNILNERRKAEILKYKANSSNITKKQQYANAASNRWITGRKRSWATQTDTYTNPNTSALQRVGNVLVCNNNNVRCTLTSGADVPGKVQTLCYDPTVPLYNYKVTRTYNGGGGKYGLYGRVQVVSLSNFNNINKTFNDPKFDLTPPTSNSPGAFTYTSSNASVATILGITVSIGGVGSCIITATQAAYSNYTSGSISALLSVNKATPNLSNFIIPPKTYQTDNTFTLTKPNSDSPGAFTYSSTNTSVATVDPITELVTIHGASRPVPPAYGDCTIIATQAATADYTSASISASLTVDRYQTLLIGTITITPQNATYQTDHEFTITTLPTSNRTMDTLTPIIYTSSVPSVATISGTATTGNIVGAGTSTIAATQAETPNYTEGTTTNNPILNVDRYQTILSNFPDITKTYQTDNTFTLTKPTSDSSGAFTYTSNDSNVATVDTDTGYVNIVGASVPNSDCRITATQAATDKYTSASISASLTVNKFVTILTTITINPNTAIYQTDREFTISPPTSNRIPSDTSFMYTSSDTNVATISGTGTTTGNIVGVGTSTIRATQAETRNYTEGITTNNPTLTVAQYTTTLTGFAIPPPNPKTYSAGQQFQLIAPTSDRIPSDTVFTYSSNNTSVATVDQNTGVVTIVGVGQQCTFTATQAETPNYTQGTATTEPLDVTPAPPNIDTFYVDTPKNYGDAPITINHPNSNSQGAFTYTSSEPSIASISVNQNQIIIGNAGSCTITAHQAADGNYTSGSSSPPTPFTVAPIYPTISLSLPTVYTNTTPFSLTQYTSSNSPGGTYSYNNSNPDVATINQDNKLTPVAAGNTTITAHQTATQNYTEGSSQPVTLTISLPVPNLSWPFQSPQTLVVYPNDSLTLPSPTSNSDGPITLSNANGGDAVGINPTIVSQGSGTFTLTGDHVEGVGQVTIVATQAATNNYAQGIISFVLYIDETIPPDEFGP
jgi:hypothetical protein